MNDRLTTRQRILVAARRLFNERGYAATTVAAIAAEVGIADGNLWYHFRTKLDLVRALEEQVREQERALRAAHTGGPVADDYAHFLLSSMRISWHNRFLMRDAGQFRKDGVTIHRDPDMSADLDGIEELLERMRKEGMLRRDRGTDLRLLARSVWMVGRYWPDHLREIEGIDTLGRKDAERGIEQNLSVLLPHLTTPATRVVEAAIVAVREEIAVGEST